jgi:peptide/nickel transport system permease protein
LAFWWYVTRRVLLLILVVWGAVTLTFLFASLIPGNPVQVILGSHPSIDPALVKQLYSAWGLNEPLPVQYIDYLKATLQGNLGVSFVTTRPVVTDLVSRLPATLELSIVALIFTLLIGIPIAVVSATRKGSILDTSGRLFAIIGFSAPSFWVGIVLLLVFFRDFRLVGIGRLGPQFTPPPFVTGLYTVDSLLAGNTAEFFDALIHLILPGLTLALTGAAATVRLLRSSMLEAINSDYVRTARMKGLKERTVIYRHAFRNALLPMTTYIGLLVGIFLSGSVLIETIFSWNGIGQYTVQSIFAADYPALQGVVLVDAFIIAFLNLVVDLVYAVIDPRIRYG